MTLDFVKTGKQGGAKKILSLPPNSISFAKNVSMFDFFAGQTDKTDMKRFAKGEKKEE